jgi:glycosyltransferase involved in cell wall biosynthesis
MSEVVINDHNGFLVRTGDIPALAGRVSALLNDDAMRKTFGDRGRARAVDEFDLQRILAIHEDLYHKTLD